MTLYLRFSDDGEHIRQWSREPFEGGTAYVVASDDGWQPIETAPKDGRSVLAIWQWNKDEPNCGSETHAVVRWCGWWDQNGFTVAEPTHWRPLPDPPRALVPAAEGEG